MDPFRLFVLIVVGGTIAAFAGWILFCMVRGWVRYYRDCRPMATRVTRSKWEDSKPHDSRDWQGSFKRIVSGK